MENPGAEVSLFMFEIYDNKEFLIITLDEDPDVGEVYHVKIEFRNTIKKIESGFYESSYIDEDGVTHYLATTQFQPTGARRAFPCFDEPNLKATFSFSSKFSLTVHRT